MHKKFYILIFLLISLSPLSLHANERADNALIKAIKHNNYHAAQKALEINADVESKKLGSNTLLTYLALHNQYEIAKLLIQHDANVNRFDATMSPLHAAARKDFPTSKSKLALVKILVESGAEIDIPDKDGNTALTLATQSEQGDVVEYLIRVGADPHTQSPAGTALEIATEKNNLHLTLLLEKAIDKTTNAENHPMMQTLQTIYEDFLLTNRTGDYPNYSRNRTGAFEKKLNALFKAKTDDEQKIPQLMAQATKKQDKALQSSKFVSSRLNEHYQLNTLTYNHKRARLIYTAINPPSRDNKVYILFITLHNDNNIWKINDIFTQKEIIKDGQNAEKYVETLIAESVRHKRLHMR